MPDHPIDILRMMYERNGRDATTQAAKDMMQAGAAWIAHVQGPDAALRFLHLLEAAQASWSSINLEPIQLGDSR
jgi:hypothetical protein